jgi:arylsulfatase
MAIYAAMVDSLDANVGRLVADLKDAGEWENTLFIFLSDNGASPYERSGNLQALPWLPGSRMRAGRE